MNAISTVGQDLRHGHRMCAKSPGFVAIAVLSIGFGTGAIREQHEAIGPRRYPRWTRPRVLLHVEVCVRGED